MKINTNSWHYWVIKNISRPNTMPESLCPYARALLFRIITIMFVAIIVLVILGIVGVGTFQCIQDTFGITLDFVNTQRVFENSLWMWPVLIVVGSIMTTSIIGIVVGAMIGATLLVGLIRDKGASKLEESNNVAVKYFVAKHNKICPKIDYED